MANINYTKPDKLEDFSAWCSKKYPLWCKSNFPFIEDTFEALDTYGLICKIVQYLNETKQNLNTTEDNVQNIYDFVTNYFDNLDVQDEIINKINSMIETGEFQIILSNITNNLLTEKVDKNGIGQVTPQNLSQGVREMITGGSTAVVGYESVGSYNIQTDSIEYNKLSNNLKNNLACLPNYSRKYFSFEQGRRDNSEDGSINVVNNCVCSTTTFKVGKAKHAIKIKPGFVCFFTGRYDGNKINIPGVSNFLDFNNEIRGLTVSNSEYYDIYEFYLQIRKSDSSIITPEEAIDSYEMYEFNDTEIKKIEYSSLNVNLQKFLYEDETTIKPYGDILVGNPLSNLRGFFFNAGIFTEATRGWITTPYYLPKGTRINCSNNWQFVICTLNSRYEEIKEYDPGSFTDSFIVERSDFYYIIIRKSDNSTFWNERNDFIENCTISFPSKRAMSKDTYYVSTTGNDETGDGTSSNPFRQISKAINEGAKTISVDIGEYEPFSIVGDDIKIVGEIKNYSTNKIQDFVKINNGVKLTVNTSNNLLITNYEANINSSIYKCFIDKTKNLEDDSSSRSIGYFTSIYSKGNKDNSHRYRPTLSMSEVESTEGTFTYDGQNLYIHPFSDNNDTFEYYLVDSDMIENKNLCIINNANNIILENIMFEYSDGNLVNINNSSNIQLKNCVAIASSLNNNFALNNSNAIISNCLSYLARNDGYNFHGFGTTEIINSIGCNCFDDGISHHDSCKAIITGGEYYNNNKGGISSPTYGSQCSINSVYSHNNGYGVYSVSDEEHGESEINLSNCLLENNNIGYTISNAKGCIYNNVLANNITNSTGNNNCKIFNNTII